LLELWSHSCTIINRRVVRWCNLLGRKTRECPTDQCICQQALRAARALRALRASRVLRADQSFEAGRAWFVGWIVWGVWRPLGPRARTTRAQGMRAAREWMNCAIRAYIAERVERGLSSVRHSIGASMAWFPDQSMLAPVLSLSSSPSSRSARSYLARRASYALWAATAAC